MHTEWHRPTPEEEARGIVAWYVQINTFKPDVQPCPYYKHHMERRVARWRKDQSVDLPHWLPLPLIEARKEPPGLEFFDDVEDVADTVTMRTCIRYRKYPVSARHRVDDAHRERYMLGNKYSGQTKHVVSIGGGLSSTIELPLEVIRRYGADNVDFFICALKGESPDLWRMVDWLEQHTGKHVYRVAWTKYKNEIHYGTQANYWIDAPAWAYSDIWDVFNHTGIMGNSRIDPCSRVLKRETAMAFLKDHYDFNHTTLHVGIGYQEIDRMLSIQKRYNEFGLFVEALLAEDDYLNSKPMSWHEMSTEQQCMATVGFVPFVYSWGAAHNNCGGFCVKAGKAHMKRFLLNDRETFLYHERREQAFREAHNTDATIMKQTRNKQVEYITLREFREAIEGNMPLPFELDDTPACTFCEAA